MTGVIDDVRTAVISGTTYYYIRLQGGDVYYVLSAADNEQAVLLNTGDTVTLNVETADEGKELQKAGLKGATAAEAAQPDPEEEVSAEPDGTFHSLLFACADFYFAFTLIHSSESFFRSTSLSRNTSSFSQPERGIYASLPS